MQHIWSMSFLKGLNIFDNAGTNHLLIVLFPVICRMPIGSDRFQSLTLKLTFDNLIYSSQIGGHSTGQLQKE